MILITMLWRIYFFIVVGLILNSVSRFIFNPTRETFKGMFLSLPFIFLFPLAAFSENGRVYIQNKAKEL